KRSSWRKILGIVQWPFWRKAITGIPTGVCYSNSGSKATDTYGMLMLGHRCLQYARAFLPLEPPMSYHPIPQRRDGRTYPQSAGQRWNALWNYHCIPATVSSLLDWTARILT